MLHCSIPHTCINPDKVTRALKEPVHRNVLLIKIFQWRPPWPVQIVNVVPLTQTIHYTPVCIWHCKPLTVSGSNIDIDRTKVIVLLVAWCSAPRYLYTQQRNLNDYKEQRRIKSQSKPMTTPSGFILGLYNDTFQLHGLHSTESGITDNMHGHGRRWLSPT